MKRFLIFLIIPVFVLILYHSALLTYFAQDDFFTFKVSQTDGSFKQFVNLFGFHTFQEREIAFYRPIFREALFNTFYSLFGLNPYPFRILQFVLLFLNSFLAYLLIKKFFDNEKLSFFVAFFYAVSSAQISPLYYLTGGIQVLGATTFLLLTLILSFKNLLLAFVMFLLALASHELASIIPFLIAAYNFRRLWVTIPFFLVLFIYLYLEITKIGFSASEIQYQPIFNLKTILNSYMWYMGWALGLPEMLIDFVFPSFKLNPSLMRYWGNYFIIIFSSFFISLSLLAFGFIYMLKRRTFFLDKKMIFFIFWFFISLIPVILLPLHKSTQYLETGLVAFWTIIGLIIFNIYRIAGLSRIRLERKVVKICIVFLVLSLFALSATSAILQRNTYWAAERGRYAKQLIEQITTTYPNLPKGAVIYFENDPNYPFISYEWGSSSKQAAFILNNEDALRLVYKDPSIRVYYEDLSKPSDALGGKIYKITAKIF